MSVNKVILLGRLGKDPELAYTPSKAAVCKFSIATEESFKDKSGEKQKTTTWSSIVVWGRLAEVASRYLKKGSQAYVEGRLSTRSYTDKSGQVKYITEVIANNVQFIGGNGSQEQREPGEDREEDIPL